MAITQQQLDILFRDSQPEPESQKLRSFAQGLTFGFADEIEAYIRSLGGPQEEYEALRYDIRNKLQAYKEANPAESIGIETIGAVAPTALSLLSGFGAGAGAANIGRIATLGGRVPRLAQGAVTGAAYSGLYGAGTAEGDIESRMQQAQEFAGTGALFGAGGQAALGLAKGVVNPLVNVFRRARNEDDVQRILKRVDAISDNAYEKLNQSNIRINQSSARYALDDAIEDITNNYNYNPNLTGVSAQAQRLTQQSIDDFENIVGARSKTLQSFVDEEVQILKNEKIAESFIERELANPNSNLYVRARNAFSQSKNVQQKEVTLSELSELKKRLSKRYNSSQSSNQPQPAILRLKDAIEEMVDSTEEASPLWNEAISLWRTRRNYEMIADELNKAMRNAERSGIGTDSVSIYKSMANSILNSKTKSKFLRNSDKQALEAIVRGGPVDNILQALGRYAPTASNTMRAMTLVGGAASGGATLPFSILAGMAKNSANRRVAAKAESLLEEFLKGDDIMMQELGDIFRQANTGLSVSAPAQLSGRALSPSVGQFENQQNNNMQQMSINRQISPQALAILRGQ